MNLENLKEIENKYSNFQEVYQSGDYEKALDMMKELLETLEQEYDVRKAGKLNKDGSITISDEQTPIYISLNHVMEYYIYAYYYKPETDVLCTELPIGGYYRAYGDLCIKLQKYKGAMKAFEKAVCWNPVDLDAILGLAESYKYLGFNDRYLKQTQNVYRYCSTRATMARYYRNMGYIYVCQNKVDMARACYIYSNIYYHTENADNELKFLCEALKDITPEYSIRQMQEMFSGEDIEPGPNADTIGVIYRVGELMMEDGELQLAKDCFSICYDITKEEKLLPILEQLDAALGVARYD